MGQNKMIRYDNDVSGLLFAFYGIPCSSSSLH